MNAAEIAAMKQEIACARAAVEGVARLRNKIAALTLAHAAAVAQAQALREAVGWMLRNISGKELRRIGIITSGNLDMDIAAALAASEAGK